MQSPLYSSPALHAAGNTSADVHADLQIVVLGIVGDRFTAALHLTPEQAIQLAEYLTEGATKCFAAREG